MSRRFPFSDIFEKRTFELAERLGKQRKSRHFQPAVCIGETNAINLELFLAPDYYQTTMERYEEIIKAKLL